MKERGGSSRQAILKYIAKNYNVGNDEKVINQHLKMSLRAGVKNGSLKQSKGTGASGSFRLGETAAAKKKQSPAKKAKKPKAAKPKTVKKTTKKASGEKKAKSAVKKAAKKSPKKVKPAASKPKKAAASTPKKAVPTKPRKWAKPTKKAASKPKKVASKPKKDFCQEVKAKVGMHLEDWSGRASGSGIPAPILGSSSPSSGPVTRVSQIGPFGRLVPVVLNLPLMGLEQFDWWWSS